MFNKKQQIVIGINLGLVILYTIVVRILDGSYNAIYVLILLELIHLSVLIIIFFFGFKQIYLLTALLVLLTGLSTCYIVNWGKF